MENPSPKSVLVVDDSRVSRMLIKSLVTARFPHWSITEAGSGDEALALARERTFDYCTMDINMPGLPGTDSTVPSPMVTAQTSPRAVRISGPGVTVAALALSTSDEATGRTSAESV